MNNYNSPYIIRLMNKLDLFCGLGAQYVVFVFSGLYSVDESISVITYGVIALVLTLYLIVAGLKLASYIYCIFQGYRVTIVGMILYCIWILFILSVDFIMFFAFIIKVTGIG